MSFFFDTYDPKATMGTPATPEGGDVAGYGETYDAMRELVRATESTASKVNIMGDIFAPILEDIEERSGVKLGNPGDYPDVMSASRGHWKRVRDQKANQIFEHIRANEDLYPEYAGLNADEINEQTRARALEIYNEQNQILSRKGGVGGFFGSLAGGFVGAVEDPAFIDTLLIGGPMAAGGKTLVGQVVSNTLVGMGTEALLQTAVADWYEELGLDYTPQQFLMAVGTSGVIGGGLPVAFKGVGKGISLTNQQLRSAVTALRKDGHISPKTADLLEDTLDDAEMIAEMPDGVTDMAEHTARVEEATADVMVGKAPELDIEASPPRPNVEDIEFTDADVEALLKSFDDIGDDEVITLDIDGAEDTVRTGKQLKEEAAQEAGMLDRLRGCVIR